MVFKHLPGKPIYFQAKREALPRNDVSGGAAAPRGGGPSYVTRVCHLGPPVPFLALFWLGGSPEIDKHDKRHVAIVTVLCIWLKYLDPSQPRMSVAVSPRRSPTCWKRKRLRPGAGWWECPCSSSSTQVAGILFPFGLDCGCLVSCVWETLIFGTGDFGVFLLWTRTNPLAGHRSLPGNTGCQP